MISALAYLGESEQSAMDCPFSRMEVATMAGLGDKVKGKAKEVKGKVTDDKATEMEGKAQQAAGELKDTADDVADEMRKDSRRTPRY